MKKLPGIKGSSTITVVTDRPHGGSKCKLGGNLKTRTTADAMVDHFVSGVTETYRKEWPQFEVIGNPPVMIKKEEVACEEGKPKSISVRYTIEITLLRRDRPPIVTMDFGLPFPSLTSQRKCCKEENPRWSAKLLKQIDVTVRSLMQKERRRRKK